MGQQHKECAFKDHRVMMKKDVPIQCGIIEKSTCVSVMEIFATHLTKYQHHLYSIFLFYLLYISTYILAIMSYNFGSVLFNL